MAASSAAVPLAPASAPRSDSPSLSVPPVALPRLPGVAVQPGPKAARLLAWLDQFGPAPPSRSSPDKATLYPFGIWVHRGLVLVCLLWLNDRGLDGTTLLVVAGVLACLYTKVGSTTQILYVTTACAMLRDVADAAAAPRHSIYLVHLLSLLVQRMGGAFFGPLGRYAVVLLTHLTRASAISRVLALMSILHHEAQSQQAMAAPQPSLRDAPQSSRAIAAAAAPSAHKTMMAKQQQQVMTTEAEGRAFSHAPEGGAARVTQTTTTTTTLTVASGTIVTSPSAASLTDPRTPNEGEEQPSTERGHIVQVGGALTSTAGGVPPGWVSEEDMMAYKAAVIVCSRTYRGARLMLVQVLRATIEYLRLSTIAGLELPRGQYADLFQAISTLLMAMETTHRMAGMRLDEIMLGHQSRPSSADLELRADPLHFVIELYDISSMHERICGSATYFADQKGMTMIVNIVSTASLSRGKWVALVAFRLVECHLLEMLLTVVTCSTENATLDITLLVGDNGDSYLSGTQGATQQVDATSTTTATATATALDADADPFHEIIRTSRLFNEMQEKWFTRLEEETLQAQAAYDLSLTPTAFTWRYRFQSGLSLAELSRRLVEHSGHLAAGFKAELVSLGHLRSPEAVRADGTTESPTVPVLAREMFEFRLHAIWLACNPDHPEFERVSLQHSEAPVRLPQRVWIQDTLQLLTFANELKNRRFVLLATGPSNPFLQMLSTNMAQWEADFTSYQVADKDACQSVMAEYDAKTPGFRESCDAAQRVQNIVCIDNEDFFALEWLLMYRARRGIVGPVIMFVVPSTYRQLIDFLANLLETYKGVTPTIWLITKPVGPWKLLSALMEICVASTEEWSMPLVVPRRAASDQEGASVVGTPAHDPTGHVHSHSRTPAMTPKRGGRHQPHVLTVAATGGGHLGGAGAGGGINAPMTRDIIVASAAAMAAASAVSSASDAKTSGTHATCANRLFDTAADDAVTASYATATTTAISKTTTTTVTSTAASGSAAAASMMTTVSTIARYDALSSSAAAAVTAISMPSLSAIPESGDRQQANAYGMPTGMPVVASFSAAPYLLPASVPAFAAVGPAVMNGVLAVTPSPVGTCSPAAASVAATSSPHQLAARATAMGGPLPLDPRATVLPATLPCIAGHGPVVAPPVLTFPEEIGHDDVMALVSGAQLSSSGASTSSPTTHAASSHPSESPGNWVAGAPTNGAGRPAYGKEPPTMGAALAAPMSQAPLRNGIGMHGIDVPGTAATAPPTARPSPVVSEAASRAAATAGSLAHPMSAASNKAALTPGDKTPFSSEATTAVLPSAAQRAVEQAGSQPPGHVRRHPSPSPAAMPPNPNAMLGPADMLILNVSPPISVLIAEDNMINQKILSHFLKKKGITNTVASNGKQAVDKYRAGRFHLVLMDIVMPIMDGIEATREIRRIEAERRKVQKFSPEVVIVALTATSVPQDRYAALEAGCNDYLIKPVSLVWLEKKIIEWGSMQALIDYGVLNNGGDDEALRTPVAEGTLRFDTQIPPLVGGSSGHGAHGTPPAAAPPSRSAMPPPIRSRSTSASAISVGRLGSALSASGGGAIGGGHRQTKSPYAKRSGNTPPPSWKGTPSRARQDATHSDDDSLASSWQHASLAHAASAPHPAALSRGAPEDLVFAHFDDDVHGDDLEDPRLDVDLADEDDDDDDDDDETDGLDQRQRKSRIDLGDEIDDDDTSLSSLEDGEMPIDLASHQLADDESELEWA